MLSLALELTHLRGKGSRVEACGGSKGTAENEVGA